MNNHLETCAKTVERADPDRFLAAMAAPPKAREFLFPLYAFNVEISRIPWMTREPMVAQMRMQYWRDVLADIAAGHAVKSHEFSTPLSQFLDADGAHLLDDLIVARHWDIHHDPFETEDHFDRYIGDTSGNLMLVAARALGDADRNTVMDFSYGAGVANWFRAIPALENAGRLPLVDRGVDAIQHLAQTGLDRLNSACASRAKIANTSRTALLSGWQARAILTQVIDDPRRVSGNDLGLSEFYKRTVLMFRALTKTY